MTAAAPGTRPVPHSEETGPVWPGRFDGRGFLVTGAAGGIGRALVIRLLAEGATVLATDVGPVDPPVADLPGTLHTAVLDVRDEAAWAATAERAAALGALDGLALCHGVPQPLVPTAELSTADWRRVLEINLDGCFFGIRAVLPHLVARGWGRIVAVASIAAKEANALEHAYATSKAGLLALVKSVGKEVATSGVTVNTVAPGPVGTPLFYGMGAEHNADRLKRVPMGRPAELTEAAALTSWLLSEEAAYSTAQCFDLSGGRAVY
jgi:NAD(P)-dependent dehydrogenase (short-subunit alcohol dehydrogenase family)